MARARGRLDAMIDREIDNSRQLAELTASDVEFMAAADRGETQLIHGAIAGRRTSHAR
jgi:hypothetical protein